MEAIFSAGIVSLALQAGLIGFLIWIFARKEADVTFVKLMFASMGFTLIGFAIEIGFGPYLHEGTLAVHFLMLWLLVRKFFDIRPLRAAGVVLSFLFLAMGAVFLADRFEAGRVTALEETQARQRETVREALSEAEILLQGFTRQKPEPAEGENNALRIADASPGRTMVRLKDRLGVLILGESPAPPPDIAPVATDLAISVPIPTPAQAPSTPTAEPARVAAAPARVEAVSAAVLTGSDFEGLFGPVPLPATSSASAADLEFLHRPETPPQGLQPGIRIRDVRTGEQTEVAVERPVVTAEQLQGMVRIRNRSTDSRYGAPGFSISATGKGSRGSYVIADGKMVGVGGRMDNPEGNPTAWELKQVSPTLIHWAPIP